MSPPLFILDQVYKRSQIHDQYGGTRQGGISPSANYPYIFIFSGESGEQHGYKDQWENPNVFSYTGEGQIGDMKFVRGNLALLNHIGNGKRVFLFIESKRSYFKFETELEIIDFDFFRGLDSHDNDRTAIKFFFKRKGVQLEYSSERSSQRISTEPEVGYRNIPNETERKGLVFSRIGQGAYRKSILHRWEFKCAVTNYSKHQILIASHIVPWKISNNEERLDVNNGILLSPVYDALFDQHLISFENNGKIILSDSLAKTNYHLIGVSGNEYIKNLHVRNFPYLAKHRENLI